MLSVSCPPK